MSCMGPNDKIGVLLEEHGDSIENNHVTGPCDWEISIISQLQRTYSQKKRISHKILVIFKRLLCCYKIIGCLAINSLHH